MAVGNGGQRELGQLALRPPLRVDRSTTVRAVAGLLEDEGATCALVSADGPAVVTDHDLAGALAAGLSPEAPVGQLASRSPVWATTATTVVDAVRLMVDHGIRHLVVLEPGGTVRGLLGLAEATRALLGDRV
jgi:CBS domain-containing protein